MPPAAIGEQTDIYHPKPQATERNTENYQAPEMGDVFILSEKFSRDKC